METTFSLNSFFETPNLLIVLSAIAIFILGIMILCGKGDKLIAGYNTASEEDKKEVNIHRLRLVVAIISWLTAVYTILMVFTTGNILLFLALTAVFIILVFIGLILANTWAKK